MAIQELVHLPCATCGERAASLRIDSAPDDMLISLLSALRSASRLTGMLGGGFKLPAFDERRHPLLSIDPKTIAQAVGLTCTACIQQELESDNSRVLAFAGAVSGKA